MTDENTEWVRPNWSWEATGEELEIVETITKDIELDENFLLHRIRKIVEEAKEENDSDYIILQDIFHVEQNIFQITIDLVDAK